MTIGIIGSGNIGSAFARALSRAGIAATIANSRGPVSLTDLVRTLGPSIKAGTREEAASADMVLVAVNWSKLPSALTNLPAWNGRIVLDANNPIEGPLFKPAGKVVHRRMYPSPDARNPGIHPAARRALAKQFSSDSHARNRIEDAGARSRISLEPTAILWDGCQIWTKQIGQSDPFRNNDFLANKQAYQQADFPLNVSGLAELLHRVSHCRG